MGNGNDVEETESPLLYLFTALPEERYPRIFWIYWSNLTLDYPSMVVTITIDILWGCF